MKSLEYYLSIPLDPWTENNYNTQEDTAARGAVQFKLDSISDTLGTKECGINIDLFYNEVVLEIDPDMLQNFFQTTLMRMIEMYDLYVLEADQMDRYPQFNMIYELKEILTFFEQNKWIDYMVRCLPLEDVNIIFNSAFKEHFSLHYKIFLKNILNNKQIPYLIGKYFVLASKYDVINTLSKLVNTHKTELASEYVLKLEGNR